MSARHSRLIILGSGPAGYSAAVYAARANPILNLSFIGVKSKVNPPEPVGIVQSLPLNFPLK